jgi:glycosyltransferase involved in cell wall biosynthesis
MSASVSIVIPVWNAEATLAQCLESVLVDDGPEPVEVIAVDNGSRDGSAAILERFASRIRVVSEPRPGAAAARNRGIDAATGQWIAFIDADCVAWPGWRARLVEARERSGAAIVGGRIEAHEPHSGVARFATTVMDHARALGETPPGLITANCLIDGTLLGRLGGFDPGLARGQDVDLAYRAYFHHGARFAYADDAVVGHINPETLAALFRKGLQHGDAMAAILGKHGDRFGYVPADLARERRAMRQICSCVARCLARQPFRDGGPPSYHLYEAVFRLGRQVAKARAERHHPSDVFSIGRPHQSAPKSANIE